MMGFDGNGAFRRRRRNINAKDLKIIAKAQVLCNNPALYPNGNSDASGAFCGDEI